MKITILTLFPEMFDGFLTTSIIKKAQLKEKVSISVVNIRDYTLDRHNRCDDTPFGGGAGLVMMAQPVVDAIEANRSDLSKVILMTPQGLPFKQEKAREFKAYGDLVLVCGHYEGFDERIRAYSDEECSIGDFVLTGGELAAMVVSDAVIRLVDEVITSASHENDSFEDGLLEHPHYTHPASFRGVEVPEVLRSGHHENIRLWRLKESLRKTRKNRPDLLVNREFSKDELKCLKALDEENEKPS